MASNEVCDNIADVEGAAGDTLDAGKVVHSKSKGGRSSDLPVLASKIEALDYNMNFKERGLFLLFNHRTFSKQLRLPDRNGTDADRDNARELFSKLGFEVRVYQDASYNKIRLAIRDAAEEDHKDRACFACMVLSHGEEGLLYANDLQYQKTTIWEQFLGDNCPSLAGKPKLFFIQACQGTQVDHGTSMITTDSAHVIKIPKHADFLHACSTIPGYYSWRNTSDGSWFVQALCNVLKQHHETTDLLSMLTMVNCQVAYNFQSNVPSDPSMHAMKQIPCITSMLTRRVFLRA